MSSAIGKKLDILQELVIDALIEELKSGDTTNISVANTLLSVNKVLVKPDEQESQHQKVKKIMKRKNIDKKDRTLT